MGHAIEFLDSIAVKVDWRERDQIIKIIHSAIGTKFIARWANFMCGLALDAVRLIAQEGEGHKEVDIKRYLKMQKVILFFVFCFVCFVLR